MVYFKDVSPVYQIPFNLDTLEVIKLSFITDSTNTENPIQKCSVLRDETDVLLTSSHSNFVLKTLLRTINNYGHTRVKRTTNLQTLKTTQGEGPRDLTWCRWEIV